MSDRIRVAHVGTYNHDSADGTEKTVAGLASWLPLENVDVEVWQLNRGGVRVEHHMQDGVDIWSLPAYVGPKTFVQGAPSAARLFARSRQCEVDLIHFHSGLIPEHVDVAAQIHVPYVVAPNGIYSPANFRGRDWWFKQAWLRLRERRFVERASLLHAVSEPERKALRKMFPSVPLVLVVNALDPMRLPNTPSRSARTRYLLYLGRLAVEQKGLDLLLRGLRLVLDRHPGTDINLLLVGPDYRNGRAEILQLISKLDLHQHVEVRPSVYGQQKWQLLTDALALVHPSRWDGLPFVVLEALAAGTPVLVTRGTNLDSEVDAALCGLVVQTTVEDVASGLKVLIGMSNDERSRMGNAGRQLVHTKFTWSESARRMAVAYRAVVAPTVKCSERRDDASMAGAPAVPGGNPRHE
jgi:glycosyltransferase involved in cell wall biosynthesis